jgi:hypothetical protein
MHNEFEKMFGYHSLLQSEPYDTAPKFKHTVLYCTVKNVFDSSLKRIKNVPGQTNVDTISI